MDSPAPVLLLSCNQSLLRSDLKEEGIIVTQSLGNRVRHGGEAMTTGNSVVGEGGGGEVEGYVSGTAYLLTSLGNEKNR